MSGAYRGERLGLGLEGSLGCGRRFRLLKVIDGFNGECLAAIPHLSLSCLRVIRELEAVIAIRGKPAMIVSDNGTELTVTVRRPSSGHRMALHRARQANQTPRRELQWQAARRMPRNDHVFTMLAEARRIVEAWRIDYNTVRPHGRLGRLPPAVFGATRKPEEQGTGRCARWGLRALARSTARTKCSDP